MKNFENLKNYDALVYICYNQASMRNNGIIPKHIICIPKQRKFDLLLKSYGTIPKVIKLYFTMDFFVCGNLTTPSSGNSAWQYTFAQKSSLVTNQVILAEMLLQKTYLKSTLCLFWGLTSHSGIFHSYRDVTITCTGEGIQILTYTWHSWPSISGGSLACHTNCDTEHPFIMVISEDP